MIFVTTASLTKYDKNRNMTDIKTRAVLSWSVSSKEAAQKELLTDSIVMSDLTDGWSLSGMDCAELEPATLAQDEDLVKFIVEACTKKSQEGEG